jgi:hypothetical protein
MAMTKSLPLTVKYQIACGACGMEPKEFPRILFNQLRNTSERCQGLAAAGARLAAFADFQTHHACLCSTAGCYSPGVCAHHSSSAQTEHIGKRFIFFSFSSSSVYTYKQQVNTIIYVMTSAQHSRYMQMCWASGHQHIKLLSVQGNI